VRRGYRFISYAVYWIRQSILRYLDQKSRLVRVPGGKRRQMARVARAGENLAHTLGRDARLDEIAQWTGVAPERILGLRELPMRPLCIDRPAAGEDSDFDADTLEDPSARSFEARVDDDIENRRLESYLDKLDPRGADILRRYYGLGGGTPETLARIGRAYGVTRERTRQLRDRALVRLRALLESEATAAAVLDRSAVTKYRRPQRSRPSGCRVGRRGSWR
jgi:RNA polymerase primary sigma factor